MRNGENCKLEPKIFVKPMTFQQSVEKYTQWTVALSTYHNDGTISIAGGVMFGAGWIFTCSHNLGNAASSTQIWHRMNGEQEMQMIGPSPRVSIYFLLPEHGSSEVASDIASFCINFNYGNSLRCALGLIDGKPW
jgi:hypothetical protein